MTQTIRVTRHAVRRYRERVKPALDLEAAREEMEALVVLAPRQPERPFPINDDVDGPVCEDASCWLELAPGIWAAAVEDTALIIVTVITHNSVSPERRQRRNEAKANARKAGERRRREYIYQGGNRRTKLERWR